MPPTNPPSGFSAEEYQDKLTRAVIMALGAAESNNHHDSRRRFVAQVRAVVGLFRDALAERPIGRPGDDGGGLVVSD